MKGFVQRAPDESSCFPALLFILLFIRLLLVHATPNFPALSALWLNEP